MELTLRLPDELDAQLDALARSRHTSKQALLIEAATRFVRSEAKTERALRLADEVTEQYAETIRRLEDA